MARGLAAAVLAGALALASGCGGGPADDPPEAEPAEPAKTVFDPMTSQIGKAQEAADTLPKERKEGLDQAIDGETR